MKKDKQIAKSVGVHRVKHNAAPVENKEVLVEGDKGTPDDLAKETIQNALFATGKLQTWDCEEVCDGILLYLKDAGLQIVKL